MLPVDNGTREAPGKRALGNRRRTVDQKVRDSGGQFGWMLEVGQRQKLIGVDDRDIRFPAFL